MTVPWIGGIPTSNSSPGAKWAPPSIPPWYQATTIASPAYEWNQTGTVIVDPPPVTPIKRRRVGIMSLVGST